MDGTIFEDCIASGPHDVTTPSSGTHHCDGTNGGANSLPGTTIVDLIDTAAQQNGFCFDAYYNSNYDNFFIERVGQSNAATLISMLANYAFISEDGGCETELNNGDQALWAFDANEVHYFLEVQPEFAVATVGNGNIQLTVIRHDGNGGFSSDVSGVSIGGSTSDANGQVSIAVPSTPGCYQFKATRSDSIRSNAFYLTVLDSFST